MTTSLQRLCPASAIADQTAVRFPVPGHEPIAVCRLGDRLHAIGDTCTHGMASLSEGEIEDGQIFCPFHGGAFDLATGQPTERPCTVAVKTFPVVLKDGDVYVDLGPQE